MIGEKPTLRLDVSNIRELTDKSVKGDPHLAWDKIIGKIEGDLPWMEPYIDDKYRHFAEIYDLPYHLSYVIIKRLQRRDPRLTVSDLASSPFYAVCRDVLVPFRRDTNRLMNWFGHFYPPLDGANMSERLEWFLSVNNGIKIGHRVLLLEQELSVGASGIGERGLERAIGMLHVEATRDEIERRRQTRYGHRWGASVASFIENERGTLTVAELMNTIDTLKFERSTRVRIRVIASLLERMGTMEAYYFSRMIEKTRFYTSRARDIVTHLAKIYNADLKQLMRAASMQTTTEVAERLHEGKTFGLGVLLPFQTFRPMLANPWSPVNRYPVSVEAKYDGIRLILHKLGDRVGWFTRNRNDYSRLLPDLVPLGQNFKPFSVILDCELVGMEMTPEGRIRHASVYEIMDDFEKPNKRFQYAVVVFDVLYLNGHDTTSLAFHQRRNLRTQINRMMYNVISPIVVKEADFADAYSASDITRTYTRFLEAGYEGAIIKDLNAPYYLGRRMAVWKKLVPRDLYDVVITGISLDERAGGQQVHGFRCAVLDGDSYVNMAYVSGLDAPTGQRLIQIILDAGLVIEGTKIQSLDYGRPDRFARGVASRHWGFPIIPAIVVTIDVMGVVAHADGGLTFRTPRFLKIQETKPVDDISTYDTVTRAFEVQSS